MARTKTRERQPVDQFTAEVMEYRVLKTQADEMAKRIRVLRDSLMETVQAAGVEDDKGHLVLELEDDIDGVRQLIAERRVKQTLNETVAQDILQANDLTERCTEMVRVVDEDAVMACLYEELLTEAQIDEMFDVDVTYALKTK